MIDWTIYVGKTKVLINCMVTVELIYAFVFACAKSRFSHDTAYIIPVLLSIFEISNWLLILIINKWVLILSETMKTVLPLKGSSVSV